MNDQETLQFLGRQADLEARIVETVEQNTSELGNMFVKDLLLGIAHDSRKHATLLNALKALVQGKVPLINEAQRDQIAKGIEEHKGDIELLPSGDVNVRLRGPRCHLSNT